LQCLLEFSGLFDKVYLAWIFFSSHAMFFASVFIVSRPSSSLVTSPIFLPSPKFQYIEPGTIIWQMWKKWFMVSKAWIAPALLTAMTAAPIFLLNISSFERATYPARSIRALASVVTAAK